MPVVLSQGIIIPESFSDTIEYYTSQAVLKSMRYYIVRCSLLSGSGDIFYFYFHDSSWETAGNLLISYSKIFSRYSRRRYQLTLQTTISKAHNSYTLPRRRKHKASSVRRWEAGFLATSELEQEKRGGGEKRTGTFLSFLKSTIPGTVWQTYVHVQINRRIARSRASKWKRADCLSHLVFFFAQV